MSSLFFRRLVVFLLGAILSVWTVAGFFMGGDDELEGRLPMLVVLGGGEAPDREELACKLFSQGHGYEAVVLTGGNKLNLLKDREGFMKSCGVPERLLQQWPETANTYEEIGRLSQVFAANPELRAIVVSSSLHMPRLRFLRDKFSLNGKVFFSQSLFVLKMEKAPLQFWFREPLAYLVYRFKY